MSSLIKKFDPATTVGELRKQLSEYPDDMNFGFLNQPMQRLEHRKFGNFESVCFQEPKPEYECLCKERGLKMWQTDTCPFSEEQHNDNLVCTRKVGNKNLVFGATKPLGFVGK